MHAPIWQTWPVPQVMLHPPQLLPSLPVSTQPAIPQSVSGTGQMGRHIERSQTLPAPHAIPQPPQFLASLVVSTQTPPQSVSGGVHGASTQRLPLQS